MSSLAYKKASSWLKPFGVLMGVATKGAVVKKITNLPVSYALTGRKHCKKAIGGVRGKDKKYRTWIF